MTEITHEICIDWDCIDWAGEHDFTQDIDNVTTDVRGQLNISRGASPDDIIYPAGTFEFQLMNHHGKYYNDNPASPLYGKIRLWLPVRYRVLYDSVYYPKFYGYINRLVFYPLPHQQYVYVYCTDGSDQLNKCIVIQDMDDKTIMSDGEACEHVLNAAGWNLDRRIIDTSGGNIINMPHTFAFEKS